MEADKSRYAPHQARLAFATPPSSLLEEQSASLNLFCSFPSHLSSLLSTARLQEADMDSQVDLTRCCLNCRATGKPCSAAKRHDEKTREGANVPLLKQLLPMETRSKLAEAVERRVTALHNVASV